MGKRDNGSGTTTYPHTTHHTITRGGMVEVGRSYEGQFRAVQFSLVQDSSVFSSH